MSTKPSDPAAAVDGSHDGGRDFDFADGSYRFRLALKQIFELQEKCKCGFAEICNRVTGNYWYAEDITETIRLGLIGGGMDSISALGKVRRYVEASPLAENVLLAQAILLLALVGPPGEETGAKKKRRRKPKMKAGSAPVDSIAQAAL